MWLQGSDDDDDDAGDSGRKKRQKKQEEGITQFIAHVPIPSQKEVTLSILRCVSLQAC